MSAHGVPGPNAKGCVVVGLKEVARRTIEQAQSSIAELHCLPDSATHMPTMTLRAVAVTVTTDNADILSTSHSESSSASPASSALPTLDHNFPHILPYSNRCGPAFLPTSCRPSATSTSSCLGAGQHRERRSEL
ncbi:hypothetical protein AZE42_07638 [Rhizopogon vesiculosus]|uniref:Uncharacterized protein n=1 Tax=Rhizopogon vesiculosus TaxID=180088 RepID=A0A1J8QPW7_9AGAM|nr:hypothetical protein AZE42_07638 [Rhizopogon vesiculosus]